MRPPGGRRKPPCQPHPYRPSPDVPAAAGRPAPCRCGLPEGNRVHQWELTARDQAEREYEARRTGEREDAS